MNTEYVFNRPEAWTMRDRLECAILTNAQCARAYAQAHTEGRSMWEPSYSELAYRDARAAAHFANEITRIYGR